MEINEIKPEKNRPRPSREEKQSCLLPTSPPLFWPHSAEKRPWLARRGESPTSCERLGGNGLPVLLPVLSEARGEEQGSAWGESLTTDHSPLQKWLELRTWQLNY